MTATVNGDVLIGDSDTNSVTKVETSLFSVSKSDSNGTKSVYGSEIAARFTGSASMGWHQARCDKDSLIVGDEIDVLNAVFANSAITAGDSDFSPAGRLHFGNFVEKLLACKRVHKCHLS